MTVWAIGALAGALIAGAGPSLAASPPAVSPPGGLPVSAACLLAATGAPTSADPLSGDLVLWGENGDARRSIASTTKLMTALVTLQHVHHLSQLFSQMDYYPSPEDSQIGLVPGERMSVHDLLLALMLPSADDAAMDLAYNVGGGSVGNFIAMMNGEARALGLAQTHYATPVGFDVPGNYSSACDLDRLAAYDLATSVYFRRIVALPAATLLSGNHVRHVVNRNVLVATVPWIHGVKDGHTGGAGYVLVAEGERDGLELIASVLGTPSVPAEDQAALAVLDYGYSAYRQVTPVTAGAVVARPGEEGFPGRHDAVLAASGFTDVVPRDETVKVLVDAPRVLVGPLSRGDQVGHATVLVDGRAAATIELTLAQPVPAVRPRHRRLRERAGGSPHALGAGPPPRPSTLVELAFVVALAATLAGISEQRRRRLKPGRLEAG